MGGIKQTKSIVDGPERHSVLNSNKRRTGESRMMRIPIREFHPMKDCHQQGIDVAASDHQANISGLMEEGRYMKMS